jgi:hypothetical protein
MGVSEFVVAENSFTKSSHERSKVSENKRVYSEISRRQLICKIQLQS